jgi:DNA-binding winged helix-turn-helix (wHTH) protein
VDEGDVWDPREAVVRTVHQNCLETRRVLRDGGRFLMISFMQPHFRTKYLKGYRFAALSSDSSGISIDPEAAKPCASHTGWCEAYSWDLSFRTIDTETGCLNSFLYVMDAAGSKEELSTSS